MQTIEYIRQHGLAALKEELSIEVKKYPGFFVLNYNQLDSPTLHPVVQECRGLILSDELDVVCRSFVRFFNYGETPQITGKMKYEGALAFTKVDGSLLTLYFNQVTQSWEFATRNAAFAEGFEKTLTYTYAKLAEMAAGFTAKEIAEKQNLSKEICYVFELAGPFNKVIKAYSENTLTFLTAFHKKEGELSVAQVSELRQALDLALPLKKLSYVVLKNEQHLQDLIQRCSGLEEGFVVYNEELGLRVKAKSSGYLAAAHLKVKGGQYVPLRAATLVATGEHVEWLSYNPEDTEIFEPYVKARVWLKDTLHKVEAACAQISDQKELALAIKSYPFSGLLFRARKENKPAWEIFGADDVKMQAKLIMQCVNKA